MKTGLVLGKFMPPHKGHEMLISFAYQFVDKLHIIVDNVNDGAFGDNYIPGEQRVAWLQKNTLMLKSFVYFHPCRKILTCPVFGKHGKRSSIKPLVTVQIMFLLGNYMVSSWQKIWDQLISLLGYYEKSILYQQQKYEIVLKKIGIALRHL